MKVTSVQWRLLLHPVKVPSVRRRLLPHPLKVPAASGGALFPAEVVPDARATEEECQFKVKASDFASQTIPPIDIAARRDKNGGSTNLNEFVRSTEEK
jgi:hypothetical protein